MSTQFYLNNIFHVKSLFCIAIPWYFWNISVLEKNQDNDHSSTSLETGRSLSDSATRSFVFHLNIKFQLSDLRRSEMKVIHETTAYCIAMALLLTTGTSAGNLILFFLVFSLIYKNYCRCEKQGPFTSVLDEFAVVDDHRPVWSSCSGKWHSQTESIETNYFINKLRNK